MSDELNMLGLGRKLKTLKRRIVKIRIKPKSKSRRGDTLQIDDKKFKIDPNAGFAVIYKDIIKELKSLRKAANKPVKSNFRYKQVTDKAVNQIKKLDPSTESKQIDEANKELIENTIKYNPDIPKTELDDLLKKSNSKLFYIDLNNFLNAYRDNQKAKLQAELKQREEEFQKKQAEIEAELSTRRDVIKDLSSKLEDAEEAAEQARLKNLKDVDELKKAIEAGVKNKADLDKVNSEYANKLAAEQDKTKELTKILNDERKKQAEIMDRIAADQQAITDQLERDRLAADLAIKDEQAKIDKARQAKADRDFKAGLSDEAVAIKRRAAALRKPLKPLVGESYTYQTFIKRLEKAEAAEANAELENPDIKPVEEIQPVEIDESYIKSRAATPELDGNDDLDDVKDGEEMTDFEINKATNETGLYGEGRDEGQSEDELNKLGANIPGYLGSCTYDEINDYADDLLDDDFKLNSLIVNTLPRSAAGKMSGHWCALVIETDYDLGRFTVCWFDPLGDTCNEKIHDILAKIVERQPFEYEFKNNLVNTQDGDSSLCGFHCLHLIKQMVRGIPWMKATNFDEANLTEIKV